MGEAQVEALVQILLEAHPLAFVFHAVCPGAHGDQVFEFAHAPHEQAHAEQSEADGEGDEAEAGELGLAGMPRGEGGAGVEFGQLVLFEGVELFAQGVHGDEAFAGADDVERGSSVASSQLDGAVDLREFFIHEDLDFGERGGLTR